MIKLRWPTRGTIRRRSSKNGPRTRSRGGSTSPTSSERPKSPVKSIDLQTCDVFVRCCSEITRTPLIRRTGFHGSRVARLRAISKLSAFDERAAVRCVDRNSYVPQSSRLRALINEPVVTPQALVGSVCLPFSPPAGCGLIYLGSVFHRTGDKDYWTFYWLYRI